MKHAKRFLALLLALVMVMGLAVSVSADTVEITESGSITILDKPGNVLASQKTFKAYRILDVKVYKTTDTTSNTSTLSYAYSVPAAMADFYAGRYGLDKTAADFNNQVLARIKAEQKMFDFAEAVLAAAKANTTVAPYTGGVIENGYKFTNLPLGYYVIEDTTTSGDHTKPVSALMLDTTNPNVEINIKADKPTVDKQIDKDNDLATTEDRADANNVAIGDTVTYVITSKVPDMTGYDKYFFIVNDTMEKGLTYNETSLAIKVGDKTLITDDYTLTRGTDVNGDTTLKIVFKNFIQYNKEEFIGKPVIVTYTATLNENAEINKETNDNTVYLQYSNDPSVDYNGENEPNENDKDKAPLGETPKETVKTYTTALEIIKTDPSGKRLTGAQFQLTGEKTNIVKVEKDTFTKAEDGTYWLLKDGTYTTQNPNGTIDGDPVDQTKYASLTDKYKKETTTDNVVTTEAVKATGIVGSDGVLRFEGLSEGEYTITELTAPAGYNPIQPLTVTLKWNETVEENANHFTYTGASDVNGIAQVTIVNQAGAELPSTGGMGTTILYIAGGILVLAAIVLLVTKKRMASAE